MRLLFLSVSFFLACTCGRGRLLAQRTADAPDFHLADRQTDHGVEIVATNGEYMPCSVIVTFELDGMRVDAPTGDTLTVAPRSDTVLYRLQPVEGATRYGFGYHYQFAHGTVELLPYDTNYVYELPFAPGTRHRVVQGYDGRFSHRGATVLDFDLAEGMPVHAARGGTVVRVVERNNRHCAELRCAAFNNVIEILHADGTQADYAHLQKDGALVEVGQTVRPGELIGYSGNTGYSSGPHLHFGVYRQSWERRQELRTRFRVAGEAAAVELVEGQSYLRPHEAH